MKAVLEFEFPKDDVDLQKRQVMKMVSIIIPMTSRIAEV